MGNTISGSASLCLDALPSCDDVGGSRPVNKVLVRKIKRELAEGSSKLSFGPTVIDAYNTIAMLTTMAHGVCELRNRQQAIPDIADRAIIKFEEIAISRQVNLMGNEGMVYTNPDYTAALAEAIGDNPPAHPLCDADMMRALAAQARAAAAACAAVRVEVGLRGKSPAPFGSPAIAAIANAMLVTDAFTKSIPPLAWLVSISQVSYWNKNREQIKYYQPGARICDSIVSHFARNYAGLHRERETAAANARAAVAARQQASTKTGDVRALVARYHEADQAVRRYCTLFARVSPHLGKINIRYVAGAYMVFLEKTDEYPGYLRHGNIICRD